SNVDFTTASGWLQRLVRWFRCVSTLFLLQRVSQHACVVRLGVYPLTLIQRLVIHDASLATHGLGVLEYESPISVWYSDGSRRVSAPIAKLDVVPVNVVLRFGDSFTLAPLL